MKIKIAMWLFLLMATLVLNGCGVPRRIYSPVVVSNTDGESTNLTSEERRRIKSAAKRGEASERRKLVAEKCYQGALEGASDYYTDIYTGRDFATCEDAFKRGRLMRLKGAYAHDKWAWFIKMQLAVMKEAEEAARKGDDFIPPEDSRFYDVAYNAYTAIKASMHYRDMNRDRVREDIEYRCRSDAQAGFPLTYYHPKPELKRACEDAFEQGLSEAPSDYQERHQWRMKNHRPDRW